MQSHKITFYISTGLLTALMLLMNYNHPYAKYGKEVFALLPIVPQVTGTVATLDAQTNRPVKKGDVLFTLENESQKIALRKAEAALVDVKNTVFQKDAALLGAIANTANAKASRDR